MYPWTHLIYGLIFSLIGLEFGLDFNLAVVLVLITVLLDIDHLVFYYSKKKSWNVFKAWNYCSASTDIINQPIFHKSLAALLVLLLGGVLYFFNTGWSYVLLAGYFVHYVLDKINLCLLGKYKYNPVRILGLNIRVYAYELILDIIGLVVITVFLV